MISDKTPPVNSLNNYRISDSDKEDKEITILIVDDIDLNRYFLENIISEMGLKYLIAVNGKAALEIVEKNESIDLVLMDLDMPVMNGFESTWHIKKARPDLPVIAQTSYSLNEFRKKEIDIEFDAFLQKPISINKLIDTIKECIAKTKSR